MEDSGIMSQYRTDPNSPLEQLRKKVEPPTPNSLNAQIEALSDKKREQLNMLVSQLKLSMELSRVRDPYTDYASLIKEMYPRLDIDFAQLITAVMERLDPTPEMPPEVRYKRSSEKKRTPREAAASIYDNPKFFPPRDTMKAEQVYRASVTQFEPTIPTLPKTDDTTFGFDIAAFNTFKDTLGQIESANDYSVRGGFNDHYLGRWQMGKAALEDVGIGYSQEEQEDFLSNPDKQEKAFEEFTKQNHEYLVHKSDKYRNLPQTDKLAVLSYAHNQGRGGALKYLETGKTQKDGFGSDAQMYIDEVKKASAKAADALPPPPTEVQKLRTAQEAARKKRTRKARDRSKIAALGRKLSPSDETKNIDYGDPRRGGAPSTPRRGGSGR
tara:strand:+ start:290 stop:1438 length:1149 start_codon:yes stop_codon:yes gene_type:complete